MTSQKEPFLREQRKFPRDNPQDLAIQTDQAYIDIASKVNNRVIGIHAINNQSVTGEQWYLEGSSGSTRQQTLRQIYPFTASGNIAHSINIESVSQFTKCQGAFTDGNNFYGVLFAGSTTIAGQVTFYVDKTNIIVQSGAGAPTIQNGIIILEWLAKK